MACEPGVLKSVPLFSLLDEEEASLLASHVELKTFAPKQRIYKCGDVSGRGYVLLSGSVRITTIDEDQQEVTLDEQGVGGFFGFASLLDGLPHQTNAVAVEPTSCVEIERADIALLLAKKPDAGMDMLAVLGKQYHAAQQLVRTRSLRNPNDIIEAEATWGDRTADAVARLGGSWRFINVFLVFLLIYTLINNHLGHEAWDPYPFILLNLILSMLAALQAPVIMMSQNRQDAKDRLRSELDYEVNRRAELEVRQLSGRVHVLNEKIDELQDLLRRP